MTKKVSKLFKFKEDKEEQLLNIEPISRRKEVLKFIFNEVKLKQSENIFNIFETFSVLKFNNLILLRIDNH